MEQTQTQSADESTAVSPPPAAQTTTGGDVILQTQGLTKIYRPMFAREGKTDRGCHCIAANGQ
jgi:hypothetical protein